MNCKVLNINPCHNCNRNFRCYITMEKNMLEDQNISDIISYYISQTKMKYNTEYRYTYYLLAAIQLYYPNDYDKLQKLIPLL